MDDIDTAAAAAAAVLLELRGERGGDLAVGTLVRDDDDDNRLSGDVEDRTRMLGLRSLSRKSGGENDSGETGSSSMMVLSSVTSPKRKN